MTQTAYKHIAITDDGTAVIEGTRFKVKQLVLDKIAYGFAPEEMQAQHPQLTLGQIYSALAFYEDHREMMDAEIGRDREVADALQAELDAGDLKAIIKMRVGS
jgi:uncharacterized protein (DUF433 family)